MKSFVKFILVVLVVLLVAYFYQIYRIEKGLDNIAKAVSPFADFRYDNASIGLDGSIAVEEVKIRPVGVQLFISIDKATLSSSDPTFWLLGGMPESNRDWPETVALDISQAEYDTRFFDQLNPGDECLNIAGYFNYSSIGERRTAIDLSLIADFSEELQPSIRVLSDDGHVSQDMTIEFEGSHIMGSLQRQNSLPVEEVQMSLFLQQDTASRLIRRCADRLQISDDEYLQDVIASPQYSVRTFGADLGADVRQAMVSFLSGGNDLTITSRPANQLKDIESLKFYKSSDVIRWLRLSVALNGENVVVDPFVTQPDAALASAGSEPGNRSTPPAIVDSRLAARSGNNASGPQRELSYQPVNLDGVSAYLQKHVRVKRRGAKSTVTGWLIGVEEKRLTIEVTSLGRGNIFNIAKEDIVGVEVYR